MQLLFENTTKYNKNLYFKFNEFHNNKYGLKYDIYTLSFSILIIYCIISFFKNKVYYLGFIFILLLISFIIWRFFRPVFIFRKEINSRKIAKHQVFTYRFYKYYFKIIYKNKQSNLLYYKIRKIFETEDTFYLYLDKTHALLLKKDSFTIGTAEEFSKFLKKKFLFRFKKEIEKDK